MPVAVVKVKGQSGNLGNDRADSNAARGTTSSSNLGRYASFPPSPPILPPDPLTRWFSSLPLPASIHHLVSSLLNAANVSFSRKPASIRKPYLSVSTQQEISNLNSGTLNASDVATLRRQIRSHAARDKKRWTLRQLDIDHRSSPADRWKTIKRVRSKYQPRTQSVCWPSGRPSTAAEKPEVLAQYLRDTVWKPSSCPPPSLARLFPCLDAAFAPFTMVDIHFALRRLKSRKAPGPDQVSIDLYKLLPYALRRLLLEYFNSCFLSASAPDHWKLARVVMIFKGGGKNSRMPSAYRPISLANSIYKLYAALLQARLAYHFDDRISDLQYGFRKARSTSSPLFIIRRLAELFERHTTSLYILFLDWSQAFDCISHEHLTASLVRIGLPLPFVHAISSLYQDGKFFVATPQHTSATYKLSRGIRQGCPLSPYLFILVLSVLMHDVYSLFEQLFHYTPWTFSARTPVTDIEYADDTVLMARTQLTLHRLLHTRQHEACKRGLFLNPDKCQLLRLHSDLPIHLSPCVDPCSPCSCSHCSGTAPFGPQIHPVNSAKYLGAYITANGSSVADCNYRYSQALPVRRRLQIYSQIFVAILLYGCESQVYTPAQITRFNALHYKVLRQIFQVKSSFYHRVLQPSDAECSNAFLLQLAYVHAPRLLIPSQRISVQRLRYLGHILRHFDSLEHKISFNTSHSLRTISSPFRIGRPRVHWPEIAMSEAYHRYLQLHNGHSPSNQEVHHPLYEIATTATVQRYFGPSLIDWQNTTTIWNALLPVASNRYDWDQLVFPGNGRVHSNTADV